MKKLLLSLVCVAAIVLTVGAVGERRDRRVGGLDRVDTVNIVDGAVTAAKLADNIDALGSLTNPLTLMGSLKMDDSAITGFAAATNTVGSPVYLQSQDAGGTPTNPLGGALIELRTGDGSTAATDVVGGIGGLLRLASGAGGRQSGTVAGGNAAEIDITAGVGGACTGTGGANSDGGEGGKVDINAGAGGATSATNGGADGGIGGAVELAAGIGGTGNTGDGGAGGALTFVSGAGAAGTADDGNGGAISITAGQAGGSDGLGGTVTIDAGAANSGTAGSISLGPTNATSVAIGTNLTLADTKDILPVTAKGSDMGSATLEWGAIFVGTSKALSFGDGQTSTIQDDDSNLLIECDNAIHFQIGGVDILALDDSALTFVAENDLHGQDLYLQTEDAGASALGPRTGGLLELRTGDGSVGISTELGGAGGPLSLASGAGGENPSTQAAGAGAEIDITAGVGGANTGGTGPGSDGGVGGKIDINAGAGGATNATNAGADGGVGGAVELAAGTGGTGNTGDGGNGGALTLTSGAGAGGTADDGDGGAVSITAGQSGGGDATGGSVAIDAGEGNTGTAGAITVGATNATDVALGRSGQTVTIVGTGRATATAGMEALYGIPITIVFEPTTNGTLGYTVPAGFDLRVLNCIGWKTAAGGADADDQWDLQNDDGSAANIFDTAELAAVSDKEFVQFANLDDDQDEVEAGHILKLVAGEDSDDGGADGIIVVHGILTASAPP